MEILLVAGELSPWVRVTESADDVAALAKTLRQQGHAVTLVVPRWPDLEASGLLLARRLTPLALVGGGEATVLDGQLPSGVRLVVLDFSTAPEAFLAPPTARAAFDFARAVSAMVAGAVGQGRPFDAVHAHDAVAALVPPLLGELSLARDPVTVLTIHEPARDVPWDGSMGGDVAARISGAEPATLLSLGLGAASRVAVDSSEVLRELGARAGAAAVQRALAERDDPPIVIEPGLDLSLQNPATDGTLPARYDAEDTAGKARCKHALMRELELDRELDPGRPLVVALVPPGLEAVSSPLAAACRRLLREDASWVLAGVPDEGLSPLVTVARERAVLVEAPGDTRVRSLLAAADVVLLPPAPRGPRALHRSAQRHGAAPVAFARGTVVGAVVDADPELATGTGFLYDEPESDAIVAATLRGLIAFRGAAWGSFRRRMLRLDLGWDRPARRHVQLYRSVGPA